MSLGMCFLGGSDCKESACKAETQVQSLGFGKIPWSRRWQSAPVFLPRESHGQKSLVGYRPWGHKESDITEQLILSLSQECARRFWKISQLFFKTIHIGLLLVFLFYKWILKTILSHAINCCATPLSSISDEFHL